MRLLALATLTLLFMACSKNDSPPPAPNPIPPDVDTLGNWHFKKIDTLGRAFTDITFTDANTGFTCGEKNALFKTSDGGTTWQPVSINIGYNYSNIQFLNLQYGFIASYGDNGRSGVLRTTNSGNAWQFSATPSSTIDMFFLNPGLGFCTSINGLLKSVDSGKTWTQILSIPSQTTSSLWFVNASKGFVTTQGGGIFRTIDGGNNFSLAASSNPGSSYSPVYFANANNGCTGLGKSLYVTNDGGATWQILKEFPDYVIDVKNTGTADYYVNTGREVWHTTNGGAVWEREMKLASTNSAVEFTLTQPGRVWISGGNGGLYYK